MQQVEISNRNQIKGILLTKKWPVVCVRQEIYTWRQL